MFNFLKDHFLIFFSTVLCIFIFIQGLNTEPDQGGKVPFYKYTIIQAQLQEDEIVPVDTSYFKKGEVTNQEFTFLKLSKDGIQAWWLKDIDSKGNIILQETQSEVRLSNGEFFINGRPASKDNQLRQVGNLEKIGGKSGEEAKTGSVNPFEFLSYFTDKDTVVKRWEKALFKDGEDKVTVYYSIETPGNKIMRPGLKFKVEGSPFERLDFISLMLALFFGTAALPHILIRYFTVRTPVDARKSTIVAIASIGFFYVLTLFMGLGAMSSGVLNLASSNMSAPLLAKSFGVFLFSVISAIAFATVLGTVSGLLVAASGAVAHYLIGSFRGVSMTDRQKVVVGKITALSVGIIAIILGILFKGMNVSFLVGWAFAVAASANLPAIMMVLFWKKTTAKGIVASIIVGIFTVLGMILLSPSMYVRYGLNPNTAPIPFSNPGIISIPLSFLTIVVVSLLIQKKDKVLTGIT